METPMRKIIKAIFLIAVTMAMVIAFSAISITSHQQTRQVGGSNHVNEESYSPLSNVPSKRVSRFLTENNQFYQRRSLKPADHCHKDYEVCDLKYGANSTCCGNKCFDLSNDKNYCGACHVKCKYTYSCCNGKCVDLAYDKRNCGSCNNKCLLGQYCIYGMCDYA